MIIQEKIQLIEALSKALNSLEKVNYITDNYADIMFVSANLLLTISTFETEIMDLSEDEDEVDEEFAKNISSDMILRKSKFIKND